MLYLRSLHSGMMNLEHRYKKLIEKHNKRSLTGRANAYFFQAKKMKEQIKELKEDARDIKINFMVGLLLSCDVFIETDVKARPVHSSSSNNNRSL